MVVWKKTKEEGLGHRGRGISSGAAEGGLEHPTGWGVGGGESLSPQSFAAEGSGVVVSGSPPPPKMMIKRTFTVRNAC